MLDKEPVRIRQKKLKNGAYSLYLDIYYKGKREYEFLSLYIIPEHSKIDKEKNKQTMRLAEAIKSKRILELVNGTYKIGIKTQEDLLLIPYLEIVFSKKKDATARVYRSLFFHIGKFDKNARLSDIDKKWIDRFKKHLDGYLGRTKKPLTNNGKNMYLTYLSIALRQAVVDELISTDPTRYVTKYKAEEYRREYLTLEEIKLVANTPFPYKERYKDAFIFSCLTGLRKSDVVKLTWKDVVKENGVYRLIYQQKKTESYEHLDITAYALRFMGERGKDDDLVFNIPIKSQTCEKMFYPFVEKLTGKKITFHCARHSFAVLMISLGVDIFTLSKLLGHKSIETTQIYAKILDKQKRQAVDLIPQI